MLTDLCQELHNWFCDETDVHAGQFVIEEGGLSASFLQTGQYFRICGSVFNDGVHKYGDVTDTLTDETWDGTIWAMKIPPAVIALNDEIDAWVNQYGASGLSPYNMESFGGYSYTKASGSGAGGDKSTWTGAFHDRLRRWRKMP